MKVCVGLSGGVDSSVAAYLLKQQGYDVFAMFMQNWHDADSTLHGDCEWEEDRFIAEMVARKIGIPFYFVDLTEQYRQRVVDYMFDEYSKGRTPNPDVLCNREIKFAAFWEVARKMGADMVATGHYCRKETLTLPSGETIYRILEGVDPGKDQSYFLCQLTQEQLSTAMFPIGHMTKPEVRALAHEADLPSADKKDSQGICFVGKVDLPTFLQQKLKGRKGDVIEVYPSFYEDSEQYRRDREIVSRLCSDSTPVMITEYISEDKGGSAPRKMNTYPLHKVAAVPDEDLLYLSRQMDYSSIKFETETYKSGKHHVRRIRYKDNPYAKIVGEHGGAQFYTIGQRKGLDIGGHKDSIFVIGNDIERNIIYVGEGHRHEGLSRLCLVVDRREVHWIRPDLEMKVGEIRPYRVRIRYRQPLQDALLIMRECGLFILFNAPQRGITPGQFAVWYDGEEMLGSGVI